MIHNRKLTHIGLATPDIEATVNWYVDVMGFEVIGVFESPAGEPIRFIKNGETVYEIYTPNGGVATPGKIDHLCYESTDIEGDYAFCKDKGYAFATDGIQLLPTVWEKGVRYFKLLTPSDEQVEFCQVL